MSRRLLIPFTYSQPDYFGGIERKILTIAEWFQTRGIFEPVLVLSHPDSQFGREFLHRGFAVESFFANGSSSVHRKVERLRELVDKYRPVAIETHQFRDLVCAAAVRVQERRLRHLYRGHTHIEGSDIAEWRRRGYHALDALAQVGVDQYCLLSNALAAECVERSRIARKKVMVVPNGIPALGAAPTVETGRSCLRPVIAVVGEFEPRKRQTLVVRAVAAVKRNCGVEICVRFIGGDSFGYAAEVAAVARAEGILDQIEFMGERHDVYDLVRDIDVHVLGSDFEGIPTSILEAMTIKKLVIATNVGGTSDLLTNGVNGFLIPPGDHCVLARTLQLVFTAAAADFVAMREAGYRTWESGFTVDAMMAGICAGFGRCGIEL